GERVEGVGWGGMAYRGVARGTGGPQKKVPPAPPERWVVVSQFFSPAIVRALLAKALIVTPAIGAAAAADGALENDAIALFYMVNRAGIFAELFDPAKNFMSENDGIIDFKLTVKVFDVGAANAA